MVARHMRSWFQGFVRKTFTAGDSKDASNSRGEGNSRVAWRALALVAILGAALLGCGPYIQGNWAMNQGDYPRAVDLLEQAVAHNPDWANAHIDLGRAYLYQGRDKEARAQLEKAAGMQFSAWRAVYYLAVADILDGRAGQGLERFRASTYPLELYMKRDILNMTAALVERGLPRREFLDGTRRILNEAERRQKIREMRQGN